LPIITDSIILVVDNDKTKWETIWNGYVVNSPSVIATFDGDFDRIVIAALNWKVIRKQILEDFCVDPCYIDNMYYRQKKLLLNYYKENIESDKEKYILFLKNHPLEVFNDEFAQKYIDLNLEIFFDQEKKLYYLYHHNKKMYFSSHFSTYKQIKRYYSFLLMEQDISSPHRYQIDSFHVCKHDIVLDAGVAEGNFALDIIDLVDKLYLVECDKEWIKALRYTFEPYKDKVEIVEGMLGDGIEGTITIDNIIGKNRIDFIKMDIEGAEYQALCGAKQSLERNNVKLDICVYHNTEDEQKIKKVLEEINYETILSDGYMIFITEQFLEKNVNSPKFVRGLVRGKKKEI